MILPTKHISIDGCLLGSGAQVLRRIHHPQTVSKTWDQVRSSGEIVTFPRFILALDLLYAIGAVEIRDGLLQRVQR